MTGLRSATRRTRSRQDEQLKSDSVWGFIVAQLVFLRNGCECKVRVFATCDEFRNFHSDKLCQVRSTPAARMSPCLARNYLRDHHQSFRYSFDSVKTCPPVHPNAALIGTHCLRLQRPPVGLSLIPPFPLEHTFTSCGNQLSSIGITQIAA